LNTTIKLPDLVLTDLRMPLISGFELIKRMKDNIVTKDTTVMVLSTSSNEEDIKKAINLGTSKINVNTDFQQAWTKVVRELLDNDKDVYDPRKIIGPGKEGIIAAAKRKIDIFGSANKA
jgi:fructose-bisphosphate aldolase class II